MAVDPLGDLYLGGEFQTASGVYSPYVTLYEDNTVGGEAPAGEPSVLGLVVAPNPTAGAATVHVVLPAGAPLRVAVFDALGRRIVTLADGAAPAGMSCAGKPPALRQAFTSCAPRPAAWSRRRA